jgi:hypothetical protein
VDNAVEYVGPHVVAPLDGGYVRMWVYAIMLRSVWVPHSVHPCKLTHSPLFIAPKWLTIL